MDEIVIHTNNKQEVTDITSRVQDVIHKGKIREGLCVVFVPHSTAAIVINENTDPNIGLDLLDALNSLGYPRANGAMTASMTTERLISRPQF